jgi:hypothetical protein
MRTPSPKPKLPWVIPQSVFLHDPIAVRASRRSYYRWAAGLIIAVLVTLWFYGMLEVIPSQREMQVAVSLMVGLDVWLSFRVVELLRRRLIADFDGLRYRSLFREAELRWDDITRIDWWPEAGRRITVYRLWGIDKQPLAGLKTNDWTQLNEVIGYAVARRRIEPTLHPPRLSDFERTAILTLTPIAVALFALVPLEVTRVIGFVLVRVAWTALVWQHSRYELRTAQFYMIVLSVSVIGSLTLLSGSSFQETLFWWLYTPVLESVVSFFIVEVPRRWRAKSKRLPSAETETRRPEY